MKAKQYLIELLNADNTLKKAVKNISASWHDSKKGYPQITITQISNRSVSHSDDEIDFRTPMFQIDIWDKGNPFLIVEKVATVLADQGYHPSNEREQNEAEINRVILEIYMEE